MAHTTRNMLVVMTNEIGLATGWKMTEKGAKSPPCVAKSPSAIAATEAVMGGVKMKLSAWGSCLANLIGCRWLSGTRKCPKSCSGGGESNRKNASLATNVAVLLFVVGLGR